MASFLELQQEVLPAIAGCLLRRGWRMATAESCTGGMIAAACTDLAGSSRWFDGGLVTYAVPWKERLLGVEEESVRLHGVVSKTVVAQMLRGLRERQDVQAGVAVSGIAGPGGAEPGKPVGTVVVGAFAGETAVVEMRHFPGGRGQVRQAAVGCALGLLLRLLRAAEEPGADPAPRQELPVARFPGGEENS